MEPDKPVTGFDVPDKRMAAGTALPDDDDQLQPRLLRGPIVAAQRATPALTAPSP